MDTTDPVDISQPQPPTPGAAAPQSDVPVASGEPSAVPPGPGETVTLKRDEYDRLQQVAAAAESVLPLAEQMRHDPLFAEKLRQATQGPSTVVEPTNYSAYDERLWQQPAATVAEIVDKRVAEQFLPEVQRQAQQLRVGYNRLAIENFKSTKRASDDLAANIMPIFERDFAAKFTDGFLAQTDDAHLAPMLSSAWSIASDTFFRARRAAQQPPKDTAPPIAAAPVGQMRARPIDINENDSEVQALIAQGAAAGLTRDKVLELHKKSLEEREADYA